MSVGALAAAIAVPVGVVLLAGGLLLLCCLRRRRRRRRQQQAFTPDSDKDAAALALMGDVEAGQCSGHSLGDAPDGNRGRDQVSTSRMYALHPLGRHYKPDLVRSPLELSYGCPLKP